MAAEWALLRNCDAFSLDTVPTLDTGLGFKLLLLLRILAEADAFAASRAAIPANHSI